MALGQLAAKLNREPQELETWPAAKVEKYLAINDALIERKQTQERSKRNKADAERAMQKAIALQGG